MTVYVMTGTLGSGKSLIAVSLIQKYLKEGKRIATNLDLFPEHLTGYWDKSADILRVPDKPRIQDFELIGTGDNRPLKDYVPSRFGLLVLDELATWFNARDWSDKERPKLVAWLVQARKHHWDVVLLVQDIESIDKQIRKSLCQKLVVCRNWENVKIPVLGTLTNLLTLGFYTARLPRFHRARIHEGQSEQAWNSETWTYTGDELIKAYDTAQVFIDDVVIMPGGEVVDMKASYTVLPPWYTHGRYRKRLTFKDLISFFPKLIYFAVLLLAPRPNGGTPRSGALPERRGGRARPAIINGNLDRQPRRYLGRHDNNVSRA